MTEKSTHCESEMDERIEAYEQLLSSLVIDLPEVSNIASDSDSESQEFGITFFCDNKKYGFAYHADTNMIDSAELPELILDQISKIFQDASYEKDIDGIHQWKNINLNKTVESSLAPKIRARLSSCMAVRDGVYPNM
jgi:hypothetical protein